MHTCVTKKGRYIDEETGVEEATPRWLQEHSAAQVGQEHGLNAARGGSLLLPRALREEPTEVCGRQQGTKQHSDQRGQREQERRGHVTLRAVRHEMWSLYRTPKAFSKFRCG